MDLVYWGREREEEKKEGEMDLVYREGGRGRNGSCILKADLRAEFQRRLEPRNNINILMNGRSIP